MWIWPRHSGAKVGDLVFYPRGERIAVMPEHMKITNFTDHDYIRSRLIPEVVAHMKRGEAHYGPDNHNELGLPGQFADIWRKIKPLKRALWDDDSTGMKEGPREICLDLIGHCLLTIAMLDRVEMAGATPYIEIKAPNEVQAENLKAAGWYEDNGVWQRPLESEPKGPSQPKGSCDECWGLTWHRDECSQTGFRGAS